jgi:hypothetical protein
MLLKTLGGYMFYEETIRDFVAILEEVNKNSRTFIIHYILVSKPCNIYKKLVCI